jgi:hypothetical protein
MALGDADLTAGIFFADFGDVIFFGAQSAKGNIDAPSKDSMFDRASVSNVDYRAEVAAAAFNPFPAAKAKVTVTTGRYPGDYEVRAANPMDDGAIVELLMRRL